MSVLSAALHPSCTLPKALTLTCVGLAILMIFWSPFSGGARLPTLLLAITGVVALLQSRFALYQTVAIQRWTIVFLLLWLPMLTSLLQAYALPATLRAIGWFGLMYPAGVALIIGLHSPYNRNLFARALCWILALWLLDSAVQYVRGVDLIGVPKSVDGRITGMFRDLHQGILMLSLLPVAFYFLWAHASDCVVGWRDPARYAWALLLLVGVVVALSGARGYVYLYTLMLCLGVWRHWQTSQTIHEQAQPKFHWRLWGLPLLLPITVVLISSSLNPQLAKYKLQNTQAITAQQQTTFDRVNHALSYRLHLWETGWHMWQSSPWTGIGSGNFKQAYAHFASRADDPFVRSPTHTHNIYVEWLAETGLSGGLALLAIGVYCVRWFKQAQAQAQQQAWPYGLALSALFFPLNTTQPMLVPWWFPVLLLLVCGLLASLSGGDDAAHP